MRIRGRDVAVALLTCGAIWVEASATTLYLAPTAWTCDAVGFLSEANNLGNQKTPMNAYMQRGFNADTKKGNCEPNFVGSLSGTPTPVGVLEVDGAYAYVCTRMTANGLDPSVQLGATSFPVCTFARLSDIVDAKDKPLAASFIKGIAGRTTMSMIPTVGAALPARSQ
ncbi:MAG: hypothetical protein HKL99_15330 [Burkholderiales bacterium]|jgi:hypothetical protein|nr:hypothetical protein [Burkholderiales bacterium]